MRIKILVVEDDATENDNIWRIIDEHLRDLYPEDAIEASFVETVEVAETCWNDEKQDFDIVLLDWFLPNGRNGGSLVNLIRSSNEQVIIIGNSGTSANFAPFLAAGQININSEKNHVLRSLTAAINLMKQRQEASNCLTLFFPPANSISVSREVKDTKQEKAEKQVPDNNRIMSTVLAYL